MVDSVTHETPAAQIEAERAVRTPALTPPSAQLAFTVIWPAQVRARSWLTLIGFVGVVLLFVAASAVVVRLVGANVLALLATNGVVLGVGALAVGGALRLFTPASLGLAPIRPNWTWLAMGVGLSLALLPVRAGLALLGQYLFEGNLDSVLARGELLAGGVFSPLTAVLTIALGGLLVPLAEELTFRAGFFGWLRTRMSFWPGALISSLLFGLAHFDSFGVMLSSFGLGLACAWVYERARTIWATVAVHATTNLIALSFMQLALALGINGNTAP